MFTHQLYHMDPVPPPSMAWFDSAVSNWQNTANSTVLLLMVSAVMVGIPAEFQPATPEPCTTTSLGANDSVVAGHAWDHSVPRSGRRDTGGNDGFTAWQIRIRSLDRRLRLLAVLWCYSGQIALMLAGLHGLHGWNILWQEKKNSVWPKSGQVKTGPTWPSAKPLPNMQYYVVGNCNWQTQFV